VQQCISVHTSVVIRKLSSIKALPSRFLANRLSLNLIRHVAMFWRQYCIWWLGTGTVLKLVTAYKYLGIIIDDKLTWKEHIDQDTKANNSVKASYNSSKSKRQATKLFMNLRLLFLINSATCSKAT